MRRGRLKRLRMGAVALGERFEVSFDLISSHKAVENGGRAWRLKHRAAAAAAVGRMRFLRVIAFPTGFHRLRFRIHHRPALRCCCFAIAGESDASLVQYLLSPAAATKSIRQTKNHLIGVYRLSIDVEWSLKRKACRPRRFFLGTEAP